MSISRVLSLDIIINICGIILICSRNLIRFVLDLSRSVAEKTRSKSVETLPHIHPESYKNKNISNGRCPQLHGTQDELYEYLMKCIRQDDCKTLRSLLKKHEVDVNVVVKGKGTLLHEASYKGCLKCIR